MVSKGLGVGGQRLGGGYVGRSFNFAALIVLLSFVPLAAHGEDWPQFRGPDGQGHSSEPRFPVSWSETERIAWRTAIPGLGWSSPVVKGPQVWLTTAIEETGTLKAVCLERDTGALLHDVVVFQAADLGRIAAENSHASPTAVLEDDRVYVHFGSHGTACLTTAGQIVWTQRLPYDQRHGPAGSPVLWGELLIVACDGIDVQYFAALDKHTGNIVWKRDRQGQQAYSTPLVVRAGASDQVISAGGNGVVAYAPWDGEELWRCRYDGHSVVPRPVVSDGLVYVCSGYWTPTLYGIRLDGHGDVSNTHVTGSWRRGVPLVPSPLVSGNRMYLISDQGVLTCLDLKQGQELWRERLGGNYSASPTLAGGHIYLVNEEGLTTVLRDSDAFQPVAQNRLPGGSLASPAFSERSIFLRTDHEVFCIR